MEINLDSNTIDMRLHGIFDISIPLGQFIRVVPRMIRHKERIGTDLSKNINVFGTYDTESMSMYFELQNEFGIVIKQIVCSYSVENYVYDYKSILETVRLMTSCGFWKNADIYYIDLSRSNNRLSDIMSGNIYIVLAKNVQDAFNQFNRYNPYLIDDAECCTIDTLSNEEIEFIITKVVDTCTYLTNLKN